MSYERVSGSRAGLLNEETLRRVAELLGHAEAGLIVVDDTLSILAYNDDTLRLIGVEGDHLEGDLAAVPGAVGTDAANAAREAFHADGVVETEPTTDQDTPVLVRAAPVGDAVAVTLRDVGDRIEMQQRLRRSNRILETLEDGVYTLDEAFVITSVNDAVTEMTGYDRSELVGSHASMLAGADTIEMADEILAQLRGEGSDVGMIESSIRTAAGESLPIETHFSTVTFVDGRRERVGVIRDITDRRRTRRTLRELNRSARKLLGADSERAVFETTVEVATSVWPEATVIAYAFDDAASVLEPVAGSDAAETHGPGTTVWGAFSTGEAVTDPRDAVDGSSGDAGAEETPSFHRISVAGATPGVEERDDDTGPRGYVVERSDGSSSATTRTLYATLGEYGLLYLEFPQGSIPDDVEKSVEILAANAVVTLGRVDREGELARQRETLEDRNRSLERLHERNDLLRRVNAALVDAETVPEVAAAVCDLLVDAESIGFALFGRRTVEGLEPLARSGNDGGYLADIGLDPAATDPQSIARDEPTRRALEGKETHPVSDITDGLRGSPWRERALARGLRSAIGIPLVYEGLEYGVLSLYADRCGVFDGEFGDLLAELGDTIADAINSIETRRSLRSESSVDLDVRIDAPNAPVSEFASTLGGTVRVEGAVRQGEGRSAVYLRSDADTGSLASDVRAVESVRHLDADGRDRTEAIVTEPTVVDRLATRGARVKRLVADPDGVDVTVVCPDPVDVRSLIERLEEEYVAAELLARRDRTADGQEAFAAGAVADRLTDRQREAARTAHLSGYFEWPRESTGEEVAAAMGITQPTFNRHLRKTERTVFSAMFGDESSESR